ncbi:DinB family protein [Flavobacterium amniphilum]|uniref:DinB family protein n=1 Tax=Flavobacterium amniphilum TaxID=1834035 RepID=UPI002029E2C5|nr:DinB family protein [Flavobacterium amniphilum]MCL9804505.1 DinB family protein [Flavobacterium amniphilum]
MIHFYAYQIEEIIKETKKSHLININWDYSFKSSADKWSKSEVMGHLIDSAINNLRRFTESQFSEKPYLVTAYNQDELVRVNKYQKKKFEDLLKLWCQLNKQIAFILKDVSEEQLKTKINLYDLSICDLEFLIEDYITHMRHHLKQIFEE